jgi:hypothetical protein
LAAYGVSTEMTRCFLLFSAVFFWNSLYTRSKTRAAENGMKDIAALALPFTTLCRPLNAMRPQ